MPKKIKKLIYHDCNKHWVQIAPLFAGFQHHPLAVTEESKFEAKWNILLQCEVCKKLMAVPMVTKEEMEIEKRTEEIKES